MQELEQHNSLSPSLTGGDIDAAWQDANASGEETVGGCVSTPDQDVVDELGTGAGLTYQDDEPLDYDRSRWVLDPASPLDEDGDKAKDRHEDGDLDDDELEELLELDAEFDDRKHEDQ